MKKILIASFFILVLLSVILTGCSETNEGISGDEKLDLDNTSQIEDALNPDLIGDNDTIELGELI